MKKENNKIQSCLEYASLLMKSVEHFCEYFQFEVLLRGKKKVFSFTDKKLNIFISVTCWIGTFSVATLNTLARD